MNNFSGLYSDCSHAYTSCSHFVKKEYQEVENYLKSRQEEIARLYPIVKKVCLYSSAVMIIINAPLLVTFGSLVIGSILSERIQNLSGRISGIWNKLDAKEKQLTEMISWPLGLLTLFYIPSAIFAVALGLHFGSYIQLGTNPSLNEKEK